MGRISRSTLGMFRGKIGNVVTMIMRGRNFVRIYVDEIANPNTDKQLIVRARFSKLGKIAADFLDALTLGFHYKAKQKKDFPANEFLRANWEAVSASSPDDVTVNWAEIKVAEGPTKEVTFGTVDWGATTHLEIAATFVGNSSSTQHDSDDEVYIFAYVPEINEALISSPAVRSAGEISLTVPAGWNGMTAHLWGFTIGKTKKTNGKASDSTYIGHAEIQ